MKAFTEINVKNYLSVATEAVKVVSSMVLVFGMLVVTGPLAYGIQNLDRLF